MPKLADFEFRIFQRLGALADIQNSRTLVAVSGGVDSVSLLKSLIEIAPKLNLTLAVAHCHHGVVTQESHADASVGLEQTAWRNSALEFVRTLAETHSLPFYSLEANSNETLRSEQDMRQFRERELQKVASENGFTFIAYGHHADDLLETRLMRFIRGTSAAGLVAMEFVRDRKLRPFLHETRSAIRTYAEQKNLQWVEDPSNGDSVFFRNWIRNEWLPALEAHQPGATSSLMRSFETVASERASKSAVHERDLAPGIDALDRARLKDLETVEKRALLAQYVEHFDVRDFSRTRLDEVLKRISHLDSSGQKRATFDVGGLSWEVTLGSVVAKRSQDATLLTQDDT